MNGSDGYDANFIVPPPNELICPVCTCVVRDPIQLVGCGHRLCSACYDSLKKFNRNCTCPTDRTVIKDKVFRDIGADRTVLSLEVKCDYFEKGCVWVGELRHLEKHIIDCFYQKIDDLVKLQDKFETFESSLKEKDAEIIGLKRQVENLTKQSSSKRNSEEIEFGKVKKDVSSITSKLQSLNDRFDNKMKKIDKNVIQNSTEIDDLKIKTENFPSISTMKYLISISEEQKDEEIDTLKDQIENLSKQLQNYRTASSVENQSIARNSIELNSVLSIFMIQKEEEIDALKDQIENLSKQSQSSSRTASSVEGKYTSIAKNSIDLKSEFSCSMKQKDKEIRELQDEVKDLHLKTKQISIRFQFDADERKLIKQQLEKLKSERKHERFAMMAFLLITIATGLYFCANTRGEMKVVITPNTLIRDTLWDIILGYTGENVIICLIMGFILFIFYILIRFLIGLTRFFKQTIS